MNAIPILLEHATSLLRYIMWLHVTYFIIFPLALVFKDIILWFPHLAVMSNVVLWFPHLAVMSNVLWFPHLAVMSNVVLWFPHLAVMSNVVLWFPPHCHHYIFTGMGYLHCLGIV